MFRVLSTCEYYCWFDRQSNSPPFSNGHLYRSVCVMREHWTVPGKIVRMPCMCRRKRREGEREREVTLLRGRIISHDIFRCFYWKRYSLDDNKCVGQTAQGKLPFIYLLLWFSYIFLRVHTHLFVFVLAFFGINATKLFVAVSLVITQSEVRSHYG